MALDVCAGGDSGGRIWRRADVHSQQPAMACWLRTRGPSPGCAAADSRPGTGGERTQRDSAQRRAAEGALVRTARSALATGDDRGRRVGHRAANHRHQHGDLLRPDYFQVRGLVFRVGGDSGQRRSRSRQRRIDGGSHATDRPGRATAAFVGQLGGNGARSVRVGAGVFASAIVRQFGMDRGGQPHGIRRFVRRRTGAGFLADSFRDIPIAHPRSGHERRDGRQLERQLDCGIVVFNAHTSPG